MKKLMIAVAAIAMSVCAQAASINWSFTWAVDADGNDLAVGTSAYLVAVSEYSVADATAALATGTFDTTKAEIPAMTGYDGDNGAFISTTKASTLAGSQSFYTVLIDGDNYLVTDTVDVTMKSVGPTVVSFNELSDESTGASIYEWHTAAVPEPTSGLLLLIGMAGLALKRKVA